MKQFGKTKGRSKFMEKWGLNNDINDLVMIG